VEIFMVAGTPFFAVLSKPVGNFIPSMACAVRILSKRSRKNQRGDGRHSSVAQAIPGSVAPRTLPGIPIA
jgi:hypothetical protein